MICMFWADCIAKLKDVINTVSKFINSRFLMEDI